MPVFTKKRGVLKQGVFTKQTPEGLCRHPLYEVHRSMLSRCYLVNDGSYRDYGGRGIRVAARWRRPRGRGFLNFLKDMGPRPAGKYPVTGMSLWKLDRIDVNGHYGKKNCRWATVSESNRNKRKKPQVQAAA